MLKRTLIIISTFALILFISNPVFASNMMQGAENTLNNIKDGFQNMAQDTGNTMGRAKDGISNITSDIKDGVQDIGSDIKNGVQNMGSDMKNGVQNMGNSAKNSMENGLNDDYNADNNLTGTTVDAYTASRTSTTGSIIGTTNNDTMVWIILAITGAIIVALVWYYGSHVNARRD